MYKLDHVENSGRVLFIYLMLAVLLHLLAVQGVLVHDCLSSGVDAGLSSFLWMSCHFLAPFPSCQLRGGPRHQREDGLRAVLGQFL